MAAVGSARASVMPSGEIAAEDYDYVVVIPDIHGDLEALLRSLWLAQKNVDPSRDEDLETFAVRFDPDGPTASPARVALVQLGDLVDRGPYSAECVEAMVLVEKALGWRVVQLYGNHELMTLLDPKAEYVHPEDFGSDADGMWQWFKKGDGFDLVTRNFRGFGILKSSSGGNAASLFVHGGINPVWFSKQLWAQPLSINGMNAEITNLVGNKESPKRMGLYAHDDAFVWTRVFEDAPEELLCGTVIEPILAKFQVARIIVGHSPQDEGRARVRCGGKVILADTMVSRWMRISEFKEVSKETRAEAANPTAFVMTLKGGQLDSIVEHHTDLNTGTFDTRFELPIAPSVSKAAVAKTFLSQPMRGRLGGPQKAPLALSEEREVKRTPLALLQEGEEEE